MSYPEERFTPMAECNQIKLTTITVDRALWERCVGLVRLMALPELKDADGAMTHHRVTYAEYRQFSAHYMEAREIAKLLTVIEDADLVEARRIAQEAYQKDKGSQPETWQTCAVLEGIRRGRELERNGK